MKKVAANRDSSGGTFYQVQRPLINTIEDYLMTHLVNDKKMTLKAFSALSGVTVAVLVGIMNGHNWVARCERETIDKLAATLKIPVLQVYVLAGFISSADTVYHDSMDETVESIFRTMAKDTRMSFRAPAEEIWNTWPMSAKLHSCMMYEQMIQGVLMKYAEMH